MKISNVIFHNFKPYYGKNSINLTPDEDKNLIIIGGRNGQGKTSFLLGLVWCLYGSNIEKVDDIFKNEVKGNYNKFLNKCLNWKANSSNETQFGVEVNFTGVELSDVFTSKDQKLADVQLIRTYDLETREENFEILMDNVPNDLVTDEDDKPIFVNDYLIPIDIAKFVFFDAEKIAEIAQLGAKAQASLMDETFGQVLGLNTHENLVEELEQYCKNLKKGEASTEINIQITEFENAKILNEQQIEANLNRLNEIDDEIAKYNTDISELTNQLYSRGDANVKFNIDELYKKETQLNTKLAENKEQFTELGDFIPFAILGYKLEELDEHLKLEEALKRSSIEKEALEQKTKEFAEKLFNKPPFPDDDLDMPQKTFYYDKTKDLLKSLIEEDEAIDTLDFHHELDKSQIEHINTVFELTKTKTKGTFENMFNEYMRIQNDYNDLKKDIASAQASSQDEFIQDLQDQKKEVERKKSELEQEKGKLLSENVLKQDENKSNQTKINNLLDKVSTSKQKEKKIKKANKYIQTLHEFVVQQKEKKKDLLQTSILTELNNLLEKDDLVNKIEINILKNKLGLEVKLFDTQNKETNPATDLSKGEQQLFVSALLKSILGESIFELPVFIDTPLGRLDQEHRDNILTKYYPKLSNQVVIFSTNTEIRKTDMPKIEKYIAKKYTLVNNESKTNILEGYFN